MTMKSVVVSAVPRWAMAGNAASCLLADFPIQINVMSRLRRQ
jgi:hypothetical protein